MAIIVLTRVTRYGTPDPRAPVSARLGADGVVVERADKGLDLGAGEERRHLLHVVEADGQSMLLTEQNMRKALLVSDYTCVMAEGRIALEGPADGSAEARRSGAPCSGCEKAGGTHAARRSP